MNLKFLVVSNFSMALARPKLPSDIKSIGSAPNEKYFFATHTTYFKNELMSLINGVGMRVFVEHYDEFASKIATLSGEGFTSKAVKSRIGKANAIFNRHLETDALRAIINSTKTEQVIRDKALAILKRTE